MESKAPLPAQLRGCGRVGAGLRDPLPGVEAERPGARPGQLSHKPGVPGPSPAAQRGRPAQRERGQRNVRAPGNKKGGAGWWRNTATPNNPKTAAPFL